MEQMKLMEVVYRGPVYTPEPGDVFAYRIQGVYRFCRVIKGLTWPRTSIQVWLTYFYQGVSLTLQDVPNLALDQLLLHPQLMEPLTWSYGLFLRVQRGPILAAEVMQEHCFFERRLNGTIEYCNEYGQKMVNPNKYCLGFAMSHVWSIEPEVAVVAGLVNEEADYYKLPDLLDSPYVRRRRKTQVLILGLPQAALDTQGLEHGQVEDQLTEAIEPRLGEWIESGFNLTTRTREILFEVSPAKVGKAAEVIRRILGSLGLEDYTVEIEGSSEKL